MSKPVIVIENLGKRYIIGHEKPSGNGLRHSLESAVRNPFNWIGSRVQQARARNEEFWAIKDISLEIQAGEVVGVIGRNGAGKSTLLKVLSRITEPTRGRIRLRGRVASLLEVGTGFHPELTGRENIFLNGAILGMGRAEIRRKFDEIVSFAGVEKFLDTPVKRYSSGMYVRLAFAVAAHLEPEILVIDEVLAVGDAGFQQKCLGKMNDVAKAGRTVLFVSHNMPAVQALCTRGISLEGGSVVVDGTPRAAVEQYLASFRAGASLDLGRRSNRQGDGSVRIQSIQVEACERGGIVESDSRIRIKIAYRAKITLKRPRMMVSLYVQDGTRAYELDSNAAGGLPESLPENGVVIVETAPINLAQGLCTMNVGIFSAGDLADYIPSATEFEVRANDFYGTGRLPMKEGTVGLLPHTWMSSSD